MNTETKIIMIENDGKIEIERDDFLDYLNLKNTYNDPNDNVINSVFLSEYKDNNNNYAYLRLYMKHSSFDKFILILNCDVEILISILRVPAMFFHVDHNMESVIEQLKKEHGSELEKYFKKYNLFIDEIKRVLLDDRYNEIEKLEKLETLKRKSVDIKFINNWMAEL